MTWKRTELSAGAVLPGTMQETVVDGSVVLVARVGPLVFAVDSVCPHLGGILSEGTLAGRRLTCPNHGSVFDVETGAVIADPFGVVPPEGGVSPLTIYPTRIVDGMVEVDL